MSDKKIYVFGPRGTSYNDDLIFTETGLLKHKIFFKDLVFLILRFPDKTYHFIAHPTFFYEYHIGDELTEFLKNKDTNHLELDLKPIDGEYKGLLETTSGQRVKVFKNWISTGYTYIFEVEDQDPFSFSVGKDGSIRFLESKKFNAIELRYEGPANTEKASLELKALEQSKKDDYLSKFIIAFVMIIGFLLLSQLWAWLFG